MLNLNMKMIRWNLVEIIPKNYGNLLTLAYPRKKREVNSINSFTVNNEKLDNKCDIANYMNIYFCDVGLNLSNKILRPTNANIKLPRN